jgi:hypothetical protein
MATLIQPVKAGDAFFIPDGSGTDHLHFVLNAPSIFPSYGSMQQVVLVNITSVPTTANIPYDQACIVQAGQHPFVVHDSFVAYRYIRIEAVAHLAQMISLGQWRSHHAPASSSLLQLMVAGVCMSKLVNREFKKIFACP